MSYIKKLAKKNLIIPPKHVVSGIQYETIMGSIAYGVSSDNSDMDIYGFSIPYLDIVFPHLAGVITGFGDQGEKFQQYQQHHIVDKDSNQQYDITIYNIVRYFQLCMENNPNMIDSLYTPVRCITYQTPIANIVRENRDLFLHKGSWHKFKGYAFSQIHKMKTKNPEGNRVKIIEEFGYDVKFAYHTVRLMLEVEQILTEGSLNLERNREQLKAIRRGEYTEQQIYDFFSSKEATLEKMYSASLLPHSPDEKKIKQLLLKCLEEHFGTIDKAIKKDTTVGDLIRDLDKVISNYR